MIGKRNIRRMLRMACLSLLTVLLAIPAAPSQACYSIVVGKNASVDGQVIMAHNEDDGPPQIVNHHKIPRQRHAPGTKVTLLNGGQLDQADQTWAYIWSELPGMRFSDSYVNEWGVGVASDNCPSREDEPEITDGGIGFKLRRLVAQRARTAREGVLLAGQLVERFGYVDSGRTYVICDAEEGWLFCVVNGKHWLAKRVADDEVAMVANTYTVGQVDVSDRDNVLACDDIVTYAIERGWYDPNNDGPFDFAAVYANPQSAVHPSNIGRQRDGLLYVASDPVPAGPALPFSVTPRKKVDITDVMQVLRHQPDVSKSLPEPSCPICSGGTQTSFVLQQRRGLPRDIGIVYWVTLASPDTSFYLPFHFGIPAFPAGFSAPSERPLESAFNARIQAPFQADPLQAFWTFSNFRQKVHNASAETLAQTKIRAEDIMTLARRLQKPAEETAARLYAQDEATARDTLANFSKGIYLSVMESMDTIITDTRLREQARELARQCLLIDTHQDTPYRLSHHPEDISTRTTHGHFDYPRAREGGLDALFMAVYVPPEREEEGNACQFANDTLDMIERLAHDKPQYFVLARSAADVKNQFGKGPLSIAIDIENGAPLEGDLAKLKHFYNRGVRYITLCHSKCNHICDSSYDTERKWHGLSPFGKRLVPEMNRIGMVIDVSHVSDEAFYQVIELSRMPVVATHSCCRHFTPGWERNMSDDMIRLLAQHGGLIQINFGSIFINAEVNRRLLENIEHVDEYAEAHHLEGSARSTYSREYFREHPLGEAQITDVVAHIDHVVRLVGIEHVGLGSDFDGVSRLPKGLTDVSGYPNLIYELLKTGYTEDAIRKICGGNFLRVWSAIQEAPDNS